MEFTISVNENIFMCLHPVDTKLVRYMCKILSEYKMRLGKLPIFSQRQPRPHLKGKFHWVTWFIFIRLHHVDIY